MTMYLYDARYNLKTITDYNKLVSGFGIKKEALRSAKSRKTKVNGLFYIIDDKTSLKEIRELYSGFKIEDEVWKTVEGSNDIYRISSYGRFKRINKSYPDGKFILPYYRTKTNRGSRTGKGSGRSQVIRIMFRNELKEYSVSRLVAYHFVKTPNKYKGYPYDDLVVYHKNELAHDNYHLNLEYLSRAELYKKISHKGRRGLPIAAIDVTTDKVVGVYKSSKDVERNLPVSAQSVLDSINRTYKTRVVGQKYMFVRVDDDVFKVDGKLYYIP